MAEKKYLDEVGVAKLVSRIKERLKVVSVMPASAGENAILLYMGETTEEFIQGGIYRYDGTNWNLLDAAGQKEVVENTFVGTVAEWDALTDEEREQYLYVYFLDDINAGTTIVSDSVVAGDMNPVTSNAVAEAIANSGGAQKAELPTASAELVGTIYQYIGNTTSVLTNGYFYECRAQGTDPETYAWEQVNVQPSSEEGQTIQVSELPTATVDNLGTIYQYVGTTTGNYINGYFYKSVALGTTPETYGWKSTDTQKVTVIENVTYPPSGTNIKAQLYRSTTGDVWAGDTVSQKTIKLTGKLEETKSLPTLTTELVDAGKCYILTEEQEGYEIGSIYKATAEKIWLSQNEEKNYNVFTSSGAFNETGVAPTRKWTPKNSTMFFATNPNSFHKVSYFDQANYTNAVVVYFADGTNTVLSLRIGQSGSRFYLYYYDPTSFIWKKISTNSIDFNEDDFSISNDTVSLNPSQRIFTGTTAEWEALTAEEKANYTVVNFPDDESPEEFDTRLSAVEDVIPSTASASNKLVTKSNLNSMVREVFRIPYNMTITNFLARFTATGNYKGEVFIEGSISETTVNHWCSYDATIVSIIENYVGAIKITDLTTGNEFVYQSYNSGAFDWKLVATQLMPTSTVTSDSTAPITSGGVASSCPYRIFTTVLGQGNVGTYALAAGHYECKVYYYGGLCGIYDMVRNQFGNNGGYIATVWDDSAFKNYTISVEQSTGVVSMSGTGADNVEFVITKLP